MKTPRVTSRRLCLRTFFPKGIPPVVDRVTLNPVQRGIRSPTLFQVGRGTLVFANEDVTFRFIGKGHL